MFDVAIILLIIIAGCIIMIGIVGTVVVILKKYHKEHAVWPFHNF
jgi:hypothetical protein